MITPFSTLCSLPRRTLARSLLLALLPLFLWSGSGDAAVAASPKPLTLRVLTYNVHHCEGVDGKLDVERIGQIIKRSQADLVALQEVDQGTTRSNGVKQAEALAKLTGMQVVFGGNLKFQGGDYGNAILSRFPVLTQHNLQLPNDATGEPRGALRVTLRLPGNVPLDLICTHLDHRGEPTLRHESARRINRWLAGAPSRPALLAGDLNAVWDAAVVNEFRDAWTAPQSQALPTVPVNQPQRQLDYVMFQPSHAWEAVETSVLNEPVASDHRPLLAVLKLNLAKLELAEAGPGWEATRRLAAPEAFQAAAADGDSLYAIASDGVALYDRETGKRLATSQGPAQHLNSGFFWKGKLYLAHSNYPQVPERSELMVLDPKTMKLTRAHAFGDYGGSLTWAVRRGGSWWCNFARYGAENHQTFLARFDDDWRETGRWLYPRAVLAQLGNYSLSGGLWHHETLLVTGHDDPVVFHLRLPEADEDPKTLQLVAIEPAPFTGQGIAADPLTGGLAGIDRGKREIVLAARPAGASQQPLPVGTAKPPLAHRALPREQLLVAADPQGRPQPVTTVDQWKRRRDDILARMQAVMGKLPAAQERAPLDPQLIEEVDCGTYVRRLLTYQAEPGGRVPAYLLIPKAALLEGAQKRPAILCLHPTDSRIGHRVVVGLGGRANRQYASELAARGYVTLAPGYPLLADYQPDLRKLGWQSGTLKAVWDNIRGIDLLQSLPFVDGEAIGAIGHSLGGHNTMYTAAFDPRVKVAVSSCGLDSFLDYYDGAERVWFPEKGWTQNRYMPRLTQYRGRLEEIPFDFHEVIAAIAPRHVLIVAPLHDSNFRWQSVDRVEQAARQVYQRIYQRADRLQVVHPDCDHDFPLAMRQRAYELFDAELKK